MSEVYREFQSLLPTYSNVLNLALLTVVNALNERNLEKAFRAIKTLIIISPPKIQQQCLKDLNRVEEALTKAKKTEDVDETCRRIARARATRRVLRESTSPLFYEVMKQLHAGGYLEKTREIVRGREMT